MYCHAHFFLVSTVKKTGQSGPSNNLFNRYGLIGCKEMVQIYQFPFPSSREGVWRRWPRKCSTVTLIGPLNHTHDDKTFNIPGYFDHEYQVHAGINLNKHSVFPTSYAYHAYSHTALSLCIEQYLVIDALWELTEIVSTTLANNSSWTGFRLKLIMMERTVAWEDGVGERELPAANPPNRSTCPSIAQDFLGSYLLYKYTLSGLHN